MLQSLQAYVMCKAVLSSRWNGGGVEIWNNFVLIPAPLLSWKRQHESITLKVLWKYVLKFLFIVLDLSTRISYLEFYEFLWIMNVANDHLQGRNLLNFVTCLGFYLAEDVSER